MGFVSNPSKNLSLHCCHLSLSLSLLPAAVRTCLRHPPFAIPAFIQISTLCITCDNFLHTNAELKISSFATYPSSMFRSQVMHVNFSSLVFTQSIFINASFRAHTAHHDVKSSVQLLQKSALCNVLGSDLLKVYSRRLFEPTYHITGVQRMVSGSQVPRLTWKSHCRVGWGTWLGVRYHQVLSVPNQRHCSTFHWRAIWQR